MDQQEASSDLSAVNPADDRRHRLTAQVHARESLACMFQLPEEGIAGFIYPWVKGDGKAGAAMCAFGPGVGEDPLFEHFDGVDVPDDLDFDDWRVGQAGFRLGAPLQSFDASFNGKRVGIDYHFEGLHPGYAYSSHAQGCPEWVATDRFEQGGSITGDLRLPDRTIPFNALGQRDHSWGIRDWALNQNWKWLHATTPNACVHFFEIQALGRTYLRGYVFKDNHLSPVEQVEMDFAFDDKMFHTRVDAEVRDAAGRNTTVHSQAYAFFPFEVDPLQTNHQSALTVQVDDASGSGWCEMSWNKQYLEYAKSQPYR